MRIPLLGRPRRPAPALEPITFLAVRRVFKPQVEITMRNDVSGWVGPKEERRRFSLAADGTYAIDDDKAREYVAKGYARFVNEPRQAISDDERAEAEAQVTRIDLGGIGG